jgi:ParB family chromosome partitioning protein
LGRPSKPIDPNVQAAEAAMQRTLATKVRIGGNGKVGRIEIYYHSADELNRIYQLVVDAARKVQA